MALHHDTGKKGETLAVRYLEQENFTILHRNWRYSYYEIDLIATRNDILHFIEVKTRRHHRYGYPEESVPGKKLDRLMKGGEAYLQQNPQWKRIQYDVLAISILKGCEPAFFFIEDIS